MKYRVYVFEKWERKYEIEANSPKEAIKIADQDNRKDRHILYVDDPDYLSDLPTEDWEVFDENGNLMDNKK